jgi:hypothetical protein
LPGFNDPFSGAAVPSTITTFAVGEEPIIVIANRHNANGLGQIIPSIPACNGLNNNTDSAFCVNDPANGGPVANGGSGTGFVSDGSYQIRNLWDQHPYPPVAARFADTSYTPANAGSGYCNGTGAGTGACKLVRRPLGSLWAGNLCETVSTAFSWPLDSAIEGGRPVVATANIVPIQVLEREALSGTYNTFEFTEVRRWGTPNGNFTYNGRWGYPAYLSQEDFVDGSGTTPPAGNTFNPLSEQCQAGFADPLGQSGEGFRYRAIGTGEMVKSVYDTNLTADRIGYTFFSFGNVNPNVTPAMPKNANYGYLMIDGVDPLFNNYSATGALDPGQAATNAVPTSWGELPGCIPGGGGGFQDCKANAIWDTTHACAGGAANAKGCSFPHLRDGTYPAWSELRMMCDTATGNSCTIAQDSLGAEALVTHLQQDIHNNATGGVPDLLPFDDAKAWTSSGYGDVSYIRDHSASLAAGATLGGVATTSNYSTYVLADDVEDNAHSAAPYLGTLNPQTQHQTQPAVAVGCTGGTGTNSPPNAECGGDVGGFVIPAPAGTTASQGQEQ